jgi:hypothetical protein
MNAQEKTEILEALHRGRQGFLEAVNGVTEDLAKLSSGPGRWSVLECVEHVALSEDLLFARIQQAKDGVSAVNKAREAGILARGADRSRPGVSPEAVRPTGRFSTLAEAVGHFSASRAETIRFVENCEEDLRSKMTTHPLLGPVNGHETLLLIVVHSLRHAQQIEEIRAACLPL